jgi:hypothetical protein
MKQPEEITIYPLDVKVDIDDKGLWFYVPKWIVRAYKLHSYGTNMGKVKFVIKARKRAMLEYMGEERGKEEYWNRNWRNKLNRERKEHK